MLRLPYWLLSSIRTVALARKSSAVQSPPSNTLLPAGGHREHIAAADHLTPPLERAQQIERRADAEAVLPAKLIIACLVVAGISGLKA